MLRPFMQSARSAARTVAISRSAVARPVAVKSIARSQFPAVSSVRWYAAAGGMSKPEVEGRIVDLLKGFDKVKDASKIAGTSHFSNDLGLDSLDTVEVVMAIEEEFSIEIPDKDADNIHSVENAVTYILNQPDAH